MVIEDLPETESLAQVLGARALRTPADRLAIDIIGGTLVAATTLWARPGGWLALLSAAVCLVCYGLWAVAERRLRSADVSVRTSHATFWRGVHSLCAFLGLAAFGLLLFSGLGVALGPLIS
jgi:hypothetical protein